MKTPEQKSLEDLGAIALKHTGFMLKAAHSLSKYHMLPQSKVRALSYKYLKQKEKKIKDAMKFFLR